MVNPSINYSIVFKGESNFQKYSAKVEKDLGIVVRLYAQEISKLAKLYVPVDQGAAKASIYVADDKTSGKDQAYAEAISAARLQESKHGHKGRKLQFAPDDPLEMQVPDLHALICVGVIYGYWLELGDYQMQAENPGARHPYLEPAVDYYQDQFFDACATILRGKNV